MACLALRVSAQGNMDLKSVSNQKRKLQRHILAKWGPEEGYRTCDPIRSLTHHFINEALSAPISLITYVRQLITTLN